MGTGTGNDERTKGKEHPMKWDFFASFMNQVGKRG
jgi:hypothetical protein